MAQPWEHARGTLLNPPECTFCVACDAPRDATSTPPSADDTHSQLAAAPAAVPPSSRAQESADEPAEPSFRTIDIEMPRIEAQQTKGEESETKEPAVAGAWNSEPVAIGEHRIAIHADLAATDDHRGPSATSKRLTWRSIPSDVLHLIGLHLDGVSLAHLSRQDRASNAIVMQRRDLWLQAIRHPILPPVFLEWRHPAKMEADPRLAFARQHEAARKKMKAQAREFQEKTALRKGSLIALVIMLALIAIPPFLFTFLLSAQLARGESVTYASLWPLLTVPGILLLFIMLTCLGSWLLDDDDDNVFVIKFLDHLGHTFDDLRALVAFPRLCLWATSAAAFAFFLMLTLRVTSHTSFGWTAIFIPLYICVGLCCCAPYLSCLVPDWEPDEDELLRGDDDETGICLMLGFGASTLCIAGPILAFVILLHLYLLHVEYSLMTVMIPLFILDGLLLLYVLCSIWNDDDSSEAGILLGGWLFTDGAFIVFKVLLALKVDRTGADYSYAIVFLPIYFLQALVLIGLGALIVVKHREDQEANQAQARFAARFSS